MHESRILLGARALGELGRAEAAVELLRPFEGEQVERIKADTLWTAQDWQLAGEQLEGMLGPRWQEDGALSDEERFDVLRAGICYTLAGDRFAADRLAKKFGRKMQGTADAEAFALLTRTKDPTAGTFRQLARSIAATDTLDAFMKEFRTRYDPAAKSTASGTGPT
jgi:hypothetical protein